MNQEEQFDNIENNTQQISCKKSKCTLVFNIFVVISLVVLYFLHFSNNKKEQTPRPLSISSSLTVAYVESDTLWENYDFVKDTKAYLEELEKKLTNDYKSQAMSFRNDYESYLKNGASFTLNEQKKKEAALQQRQNDLMELEKKYGNQLAEIKQTKNIEVQDSIFSYINRYNQGPKYTFILEKSRISGILFANDSLDITKEVIEGLNDAYRKGKKK